MNERKVPHEPVTHKHQQFLKKRKVEKTQEWKTEISSHNHDQLLEMWQKSNRETKLHFLTHVLFEQKEGQQLFKEMKEIDADYYRYSLLMKQLSGIYKDQKVLDHSDLIDLLAPIWTHNELKQNGFRIGSHTFQEGRKRGKLKEEERIKKEFEEDQNPQHELDVEGNDDSIEDSTPIAFSCSIPNLNPMMFVLPARQKKLVYLEPGTREILEGTVFHHF